MLFFFQAEDGIRDLVRSRGLGDVYKRQDKNSGKVDEDEVEAAETFELPGADLSHEELTVRVLSLIHI